MAARVSPRSTVSVRQVSLGPLPPVAGVSPPSSRAARGSVRRPAAGPAAAMPALQRRCPRLRPRRRARVLGHDHAEYRAADARASAAQAPVEIRR
ncbi:MAG: hypothetical protein U5K43_00170 [Halofilum sp. (in: g-proteobacteria)]|nr:hypothetical protein [Halofilum sp. (in: g-proteobacteria)]